MSSLIWVNNKIHEDFAWAVGQLDNSSGIRLLKAVHWTVKDATLSVYCDACPQGMGFWYPCHNVRFYSPTPSHENPDLIFYFEALCVLSALYDAHCLSRVKGNGQFIIYTDNSNTVNIFNTLCTLPPNNHLLKAAMDILNLGDYDMQVLHIPGVKNEVVDALSQANFEQAMDLAPDLKITPFKPWAWSPNENGSLTF